jgi:foldase protein PrsA
VSKTFRCIPALGAVFLAAIGLSACGGLSGNAVVQVNGTPITQATFNHWMEVAAQTSTSGTGAKPVVPLPPDYSACIAHLAATAPKPAKGQTAPTHAQLKAQCETQYKALQQEVLGFLISSQWVIEEAKAQGVKVSDKAVKAQFERVKRSQFPKPAEFEKFLATSGQTVSDLLLRVKLNLLTTQITQKINRQKHPVSQAEIEKYYQEHKSRFGAPEKRTVAEVLTKTEAEAKSAKQEIASGKSFASVAKKVSIDPNAKANGGLFVGLTKGSQAPAVDNAIFSAQKNVLSGPVKGPFGYVVFEVKNITAGHQQPFSQVQSSIKAQLTAVKQQKAFSTFVQKFKKTWKAKTECRSGYVVADCNEFKAPKTSSAATAPVGGG